MDGTYTNILRMVLGVSWRDNVRHQQCYLILCVVACANAVKQVMKKEIKDDKSQHHTS